jgi:subtilisin family serine protease
MSVFASSAGEIIRSSDPVSGMYIATFDPETSDARNAASEIANMHGLAADHIYEHALKGFSFRGPEAKALAISKNPNVSRVFEATKFYAGGSGTQMSPPWGLDRIDQGLTAPNGTFNYYYSGANVVAYVIDSGINPTPGIPASRIRESRSFITGDSSLQDCAGNSLMHGTFVAEVIGGQVYGVAKDVTFVNYRVLGCDAEHLSNPWTSDADVAAALDQVVAAHSATESAVVNLSLYSNAGADAIIDAAVARVVADGVTVVTIAGNITPQSPSTNACDVSPAHLGASTTPNGIITVAATRSGDTVWDGSKQGACVDIYAPGSSIQVQSSWYVTGTSFAAPHVAGVAAMHLERLAAGDPYWRSPQEIERAVISNGWAGYLTGVTAGSPNLFLYSGVQKRRACC